ncbi:DEAD/DEAH box helicase [bacterium AH-315-C07]|nr:DEAD/DEAH box helicase [bacterium AH-315-C07]
MELAKIIAEQKETLSNSLDKNELTLGEVVFHNGECQLLSQTATQFDFIVTSNSKNESVECKLEVEGGHIIPLLEDSFDGWEKLTYACLMKLEDELHQLDPKIHEEHQKYSREGMLKRVLAERLQKARTANYRIKWADNIYGDHTLTNEKGVKYKVFLRDFENETGYSDSLDSKYNKLGTTKHIMYAFNEMKAKPSIYRRLRKTSSFFEIFLNPLDDHKIGWFFNGELQPEEQLLVSKFFTENSYSGKEDCSALLEFLKEAKKLERVIIRPEVEEKVEKTFETQLLHDVENNHNVDYSLLKIQPYDYQKTGIQFATFKKGAIIADEMGLGKTVQAIGAAIAKKNIFDFKKVLVVCPASLKAQWKKEIERFSHEKALVVQGTPEERALQYFDKDHFFLIANYESILRDQLTINRAELDFLILDEAQRAKNFETKTASSLKRLKTKHTLIITGTPIENKLIDLYSIIGIFDQHFLGPLWEFSYQHCLFDPGKPNKINGYYDLKKLKSKLSTVLIRREKREILKELPNLQQMDIPIGFTPLQSEYHASYANGIAQIVNKKFLTPYDLTRLQQLLTSMRMVCDSTYLIDEETNESPKLEELKYILLEKLNLQNEHRKIIIFSEWIKVHKLIGRLLRELNIGFVELNGKVPVKLRGKLIEKFETDDQCKIFLSTEAGGVGLNLQIADTVINFELPWNPAKKNQRIGRIDRLGQKNEKLTVFNFITRGSIEERIAGGLLLKQNLFEGALVGSNATDFVDFSNKGKSQFIEQLQELISENSTSSYFESIEQNDEIKETGDVMESVLDFSDEEEKEQVAIDQAKTEVSPDTTHGVITPGKELEDVMNNGMQFLAGLFKMSTGKELSSENQQVSVDAKTGEVTIKFKIPKS